MNNHTKKHIHYGIVTAVVALLLAPLAAPARGRLRIGWSCPTESYVNAWGVDPEQQHADFGENENLRVKLIKTNIPANILWPGDRAELVFQFENLTDAPLVLEGVYDLDHQAARNMGLGGLGKTRILKIGDVAEIPLKVYLPPKGYKHVTIKPTIPETFGGYVIIVDIRDQGRFFGAGLARVRKNVFPKTLYRRYTMDAHSIDQMKRLAAYPNRQGINWKSMQDDDFDEWYKKDRRIQRLREFQQADMTVTVEFGIGGGKERMALGMWRPHLDENNVMKRTKCDIAWMPQYDKEFEEFVYKLCCDFGYPKGPINGVMLWNEPWEGMSISGWGADMIRYREIYKAMAQAVERARKDAKVDVLIGGCDSSSNTQDKLLPDNDSWLKWIDFMSIHYQGNNSYSTIKKFQNRKHYKGRTLIWDTESWAANTEDGVAAMVAGCASFGYDRIVGIYGGGTINQLQVRVRQADGKAEKIEVPHAWPINAAIAATQSYLGERKFDRLLFPKGLPWVLTFDGMNDNAEDGTVVVVGSIAEAFRGSFTSFPLRNVRGLEEIAWKEELKQALAALPEDAPPEHRKLLEDAINKYYLLTGASMTLENKDNRFRLFGTYGNEIEAKDGKFVIPLNGTGYYLRTDGSKGSYKDLLKAVKSARIDGYEPLDFVCRDMTKPIHSKPTMRLEVTNMLNRPVSGSLQLTLGELTVDCPKQLSLQAHETKTINVRITDGTARPDNTYPLRIVFDGGKDGQAIHEENMRVNVIHRRSIAVDGKLDDWKNAIPQPIAIDKSAKPTLEQLAWFPYEKMPEALPKGFATAFLACDDKNFYFAAKVADETPHPGTVRFETRDDDAYYYPKVAISFDSRASLMMQEVSKPVDNNDTKLLQHPTAKTRVNTRWQYKMPATKFGVDITIPKGKPQRVAFFIPPWRSHGMNFEVIDLERNKRIGRSRSSGARNYNGQYVVCNLEGRLRVTISGPSWRRVSLAGIFFDPPVIGKNGKPERIGRPLSIDYDTSGNWKGKYGKNGYQVLGAEPKLPQGVTISVPDIVKKTEHVWPEGVRRYSYRKQPDLPAAHAQGTRTDNIQIAFNAIPAGDPEGVGGEWEVGAFPKGTRFQYVGYRCTDYEYCLNPVAPKYGGGTEIWRMKVPGMPHKHFYPRQPKTKYDAPVKNGKLVIKQDGNTRIVECSIPWSELPHVKKLLDAGKPVKFSYRVNDNAGVGCMELAKERSVSKRNGAFHVDWNESWANEVEFGWGAADGDR